MKSISLDERTAPLANEKNNFSAWVREQLLKEIQYTIPCVFFKVHIMDRRGIQIYDDVDGIKQPRVIQEICNGQKKPSCLKCYPEGPPERKDWLEYANGRIDKQTLLARASETWKWRTDQLAKSEDLEKEKKEPQMGGEKPRKAYLRRFLTWFWSYIW